MYKKVSKTEKITVNEGQSNEYITALVISDRKAIEHLRPLLKNKILLTNVNKTPYRCISAKIWLDPKKRLLDLIDITLFS